ncbi:zinc finger protein OZF-like isoform X2 [Wyeomyia smithii]|uniref:zinc finger protein OZF-like isoform X2 n=1 Tax=Wyeomyia smithii TaxID=174621 RepID=UPI002467CD00|nr:zinc finger protein OZF-like isoform X2 [Wyeomyia smithii]
MENSFCSELTQIKVEELIIFDTLPAEEETAPISDRCSDETTVTSALSEGSAEVIQESVTDITDEEKTTTAKNNLENHSRTNGKRPFACNICNKTYSHSKNLWSHKKVHTREGYFECSICERRFLIEKRLSSHMNIHRTDCPHQCRICGKKCATKHDLADHMPLHSDERAFECAICGRSFKRSRALKLHLNRNHKDGPSSSISSNALVFVTAVWTVRNRRSSKGNDVLLAMYAVEHAVHLNVYIIIWVFIQETGTSSVTYADDDLSSKLDYRCT